MNYVRKNEKSEKMRKITENILKNVAVCSACNAHICIKTNMDHIANKNVEKSTFIVM